MANIFDQKYSKKSYFINIKCYFNIILNSKYYTILNNHGPLKNMTIQKYADLVLKETAFISFVIFLNDLLSLLIN